MLFWYHAMRLILSANGNGFLKTFVIKGECSPLQLVVYFSACWNTKQWSKETVNGGRKETETDRSYNV